MEVVPIALETIRDLLVAEAKFLSGVSNKVREVDTDLRSIQAFLTEADKRQVTDERIRKLVREIGRLAYEIEDVLDNFSIKVASRRKDHRMKKVLKRYACIFDECLDLHKIGTDIEDINTRLADLRKSFDNYGESVMPFANEDDGQSYNSKLQRQTYSDEIEEYFVGMGKDITHLVQKIIDDHENAHRVISIHGMGGLGKTTLAQKIYNHNDVQNYFEAFAWVTITQKLDKETILRDILKSLLPYSRKDSVTNMQYRELVEELRKEQKNRKCLVVLDDMWETGQWNELSSAFPGGNSKVLITTRKKTLTNIGFTYSLGFLSEDEGWELLQMKVFGKTIPEDVQREAAGLENIGREMVRKCGKLPLAISVLGGILREKRSLDYWKDVSNDVDSYLSRSDQSDEEYGHTLQVLALSYNSLPYHLKPCFLHLGQFQEDKDIENDKLCQMWIAEGMISFSHRRKEEDTLMDVAEMYLIEMANRSMVQLKVDDEDDLWSRSNIVSCCLHDLWRDFCLAHAEKVEFLKILDFRGGKDPVSNSPYNNPWRYSIYMDSGEGRQNTVNMELGANRQLRSFYICDSPFYSFNSSSVDINLSFLQKLKFLRVLLIENYDFGDGVFPEGIKKLIHLRLLGLIGSRLKKLPQWICKLQCLQVLDLRVHNPIEVPNCLWKLKQLRHLYLPEGWPKEFKGKVKLTGLTNLETLVGFNDEINEIEDLSEMINFRFLIAVLNGNKSLTQFVSHTNNHLHKLKKIILGLSYASTHDKLVPLEDAFKCIGLICLEIEEGACDFKKFEAPSTSNLIRLDLEVCKIKGDPMEALGKLSNLRSLILGQSESLDEGFVCENMFCDSKAFPKLTSLELWSFRSLKKWVVCEGAMPNLSRLQINSCYGLEMIPDGFRFLNGLKELVTAMPKNFNDRVRVIDGIKGVDFDKVSHVPYIQLDDDFYPEERNEDGPREFRRT